MKKIIAVVAISAALGSAGCAAPETDVATFLRTTSAVPSVYVTVPEVYGRNGGIVVDELKSLGFTDIELAAKDVSTTSISRPQDWRAFAIEPSAGEIVRSDTHVVVTFTEGFRYR